MATYHSHIDCSWPEFISKIKLSATTLPEIAIDDGPDLGVAAAVWNLLTDPAHCGVLDRCDTYLERHGQQVESLSRQIAARGPFAHVVEFGAGKALLGRVLQDIIPGVKLTNVEINDGVPSFDGIDTKRITLDVSEKENIKHLLQSLQGVGRVCVVAKHLCGSATDALLQALVLSPVDAIFVAPCCHSRIKDWSAYCNTKFLIDRNFEAHEWPMLLKLLAVSRLPVDLPVGDQRFSSWHRWEDSFGGRVALIGIGRQVRMMIEDGRAAFLRAVGLHARVVQYAPLTSTSENLLIIAEKSLNSIPATVTVPRSGVILDVPSGALRTSQFLMELRGRIAAQQGLLPWLSIVACSDDAVAVLGADVDSILSSMKCHAALLASLRVVNRIYPFSSSVPSLEDIPLPPKHQGPFRLAITPKDALRKVLARAATAGLDLSPQQFSSSISVCRLWDGSWGFACLPRARWDPSKEPQNWEQSEGVDGALHAIPETITESSRDGIEQRHSLCAAIHQIAYRLEEWHLRLTVPVRGTRVFVCTDQEEAWHMALVACGAELVELDAASILIVVCKQSFKDGLAMLSSCQATTAIFVIPIATKRKQSNGRASRATKMLDEVSKSVTGMHMTVHHLLSNRDQERTVVFRRAQ